MKLLSGVATLEYLDPTSSFETKISLASNSKTLVIQAHLILGLVWMTELPKNESYISARLAFNSMSALKRANKGLYKILKFYIQVCILKMWPI